MHVSDTVRAGMPVGLSSPIVSVASDCSGEVRARRRLQAVEYQTQGHDTTAWHETSKERCENRLSTPARAGHQHNRPSMVVRFCRLLPRTTRQRPGTQPQPSGLMSP
jgi:hypothetical protein